MESNLWQFIDLGQYMNISRIFEPEVLLLHISIHNVIITHFQRYFV